VGGGLVIAAVCDLRIATPGSCFGVPVARTVGNCLSMNSYSLLVQHLGPARTKDLLLRARLLSGAEAQEAGFVAELCDDEELDGVVRATVRSVRGRARVLAHVGRPTTAGTIRAARAALEAGVDAVSALVPYYYRYEDAEIVSHFHALIEACRGRDVYAYTIPARTGNDLSSQAAQQLARAGLHGVKDSTKSFERLLEYLQCGIDVLTGTDAFVRDSFAAGAAGCVSAIANVRPDLLCALRDGGSQEVQDEISALRSRLPFSRLKDAVAERLPDYPARYRPPLT
jgi:hypothetical protein